MRFLLGMILIAILSAVAEYFMPWWTIAIASFIVAFFAGQRGGRSFLMGFLGVGLLWLAVAMMHDVANEHILSARMAKLFHLPNYALFICVTVLIGGLVGGFSALVGSAMRTTKTSNA